MSSENSQTFALNSSRSLVTCLGLGPQQALYKKLIWHPDGNIRTEELQGPKARWPKAEPCHMCVSPHVNRLIIGGHHIRTYQNLKQEVIHFQRMLNSSAEVLCSALSLFPVCWKSHSSNAMCPDGCSSSNLNDTETISWISSMFLSIFHSKICPTKTTHGRCSISTFTKKITKNCTKQSCRFLKCESVYSKN